MRLYASLDVHALDELLTFCSRFQFLHYGENEESGEKAKSDENTPYAP